MTILAFLEKRTFTSGKFSTFTSAYSLESARFGILIQCSILGVRSDDLGKLKHSFRYFFLKKDCQYNYFIFLISEISGRHLLINELIVLAFYHFWAMSITCNSTDDKTSSVVSVFICLVSFRPHMISITTLHNTLKYMLLQSTIFLNVNHFIFYASEHLYCKVLSLSYWFELIKKMWCVCDVMFNFHLISYFRWKLWTIVITDFYIDRYILY